MMVSLTEGQKAILSPEAVEFLTKIRHPPLANTISSFITSPCRVPGLRQGFTEKTAPGETLLIEKHKIQITETLIAGVSVVIIKPPVIKPEKQKKILFNVFGGAFIMGSPRDRAALTMAYPEARDQCLAVYSELLQNGPPGGAPVDPSDIHAMGCSSGAQILVSMLLVARQKGLPMPTAGMYLCTPALDLSGAGDSMVFNSLGRDIMPVSLLTGMVSQNYAPDGIDVTNPLYSPIYADYDESFPPTVITVGTQDFALSHGIRFYWKLREAGVKVELLVSEGMWHGFNWGPVIPESIRARAAVIEFLEDTR
ncbi:alpha beta hydrolase [Fusarium globosum]|uniref:Alpha beta hydrolase n=1 Tax=Fusarium globosum TaxID=78864 RepID=A0A8H5YD71_9HYPO|nr:alpha beta hydrolase [Fusarium globosum]